MPPVLLVVFMVIFTKKFADIINAVLITPVLSSVTESTIKIDSICLAGALLIIGCFIVKAWKLIELSMLLEIYIWMSAVIYLYYRLGYPPYFAYTPLKTFSSLYLTDIILAPSIGILAYYLLYAIRYKIKKLADTPQSRGFESDAPLVLNKSNDYLGRLDYINDLCDKILSTKPSKHSFAIGVIGPWGAGKTAFMETLESRLKGKPDVMVMRFNPWFSHNPDNITSIFFSDLATRLSELDNSLKTEITSYSRDLLKTVDNNSFAFIRQLFDASFKEKGLQEQYDLINKRITRLNKKIIVFIDDVDRLDKKEVVEVLKIIRNTADFGNVFFVVAFDKPYVNACINETLVQDSETYLEKIFQLEYYLPANPDKDVFTKSLYRRLKGYVPEDFIKVLDSMENPDRFKNGTLFINHFEVTPPLNKYIRSFRDVNRFINVFLLNYDRIKYEAYLPDYISICLLRLRYPEVYQLLYYRKEIFLTFLQSFNTMNTFEKELYLTRSDKDDYTLGKTKLYIYLEDNYSKLALNKKEIEEVVTLVKSIFPISGAPANQTLQRTLKNNHLTIGHRENFDRYFDFSMAGRLDQLEFDTSMTLPMEDLEKKIREWTQSRQIMTDLMLKLENLPEPTTIDQFEKNIKAIIYFTFQPNPASPKNLLTYNFRNFLKNFTSRDDNSILVTQSLYAGDNARFKAFFRSLYLDNISKGKWAFIYGFVVDALEETSEDRFFIKHNEIKILIKDSFLALLKENLSTPVDVLQFYNHAIRLFQNPNSIREDIEPFDDGIEMTNELQNWLGKSLKPLLEFNIFIEPPGTLYKEGRWPRVIYGSDEDWQNVLEKHSRDPNVAEYIRFRNNYKEAGRGINFQFDLLTPLTF